MLCVKLLLTYTLFSPLYFIFACLIMTKTLPSLICPHQQAPMEINKLRCRIIRKRHVIRSRFLFLKLSSKMTILIEIKISRYIFLTRKTCPHNVWNLSIFLRNIMYSRIKQRLVEDLLYCQPVWGAGTTVPCPHTVSISFWDRLPNWNLHPPTS